MGMENLDKGNNLLKNMLKKVRQYNKEKFQRRSGL